MSKIKDATYKHHISPEISRTANTVLPNGSTMYKHIVFMERDTFDTIENKVRSELKDLETKFKPEKDSEFVLAADFSHKVLGGCGIAAITVRGYNEEHNTDVKLAVNAIMREGCQIVDVRYVEPLDEKPRRISGVYLRSAQTVGSLGEAAH